MGFGQMEFGKAAPANGLCTVPIKRRSHISVILFWVKVFGDRVAHTGRYPLHANVSGASSQSTGQGIDEDDTAILDRKKSVFLTTERTIYNNAGERIFHSKIRRTRISGFVQ